MTTAQTRQDWTPDQRGHQHVTGSAWVPAQPQQQQMTSAGGVTGRVSLGPWLTMGIAVGLGLLAACVIAAETRRRS
jgi:hypothetical protein